jgi:hypothetical protein
LWFVYLWEEEGEHACDLDTVALWYLALFMVTRSTDEQSFGLRPETHSMAPDPNIPTAMPIHVSHVLLSAAPLLDVVVGMIALGLFPIRAAAVMLASQPVLGSIMVIGAFDIVAVTAVPLELTTITV